MLSPAYTTTVRSYIIPKLEEFAKSLGAELDAGEQLSIKWTSMGKRSPINGVLNLSVYPPIVNMC